MFRWFRRDRRRVPKKFLAPRPMVSPAERQHPFWALVPLEVLALGICTLMLALGLFANADNWLHARMLRWFGSGAPSEKVVVVLVPANHLRRDECSRTLPELLRHAGASLGLLVDPLDSLCAASESSPRVAAFTRANERRDGEGRVFGFSPTAELRQIPELAPLETSRWVAPRRWRSMPMLSLDDVVAHRVPAALLQGRIVVLALEEPRAPEGTESVGPRAAELGASLAAALEDRPRRIASQIASTAIVVCLLALVAIQRRRTRFPFVPRWSAWAFAVLLAALGVAGALGLGWLLPLPSLAAATAIFAAITELPAALAARRARAGASRLLGGAADLGARASHLLSDDEFWNRLARRVEQTHEADGVLIAELPPFSWRLRVWPNGDLNESIIRERRRDIRRTPFVDEAGGRRAAVVDLFVVMNGVPTVLVPLEASGEVEGFLILIGKTAAHAFLDKPQVTTRLADELATLIRNRRMERVRSNDWRRPTGTLVENPAQASEHLLQKARTAIEDIELFEELVQRAPVGLLYADAFGDVRMIGPAFTERLRDAGVSLANRDDAPERASLPPGRLQLGQVLTAIASLSGRPPPSLSDITVQGIAIEMALKTRGEILQFTAKRLETNGEASGFLATLVAVPRLEYFSIAPEPISRLPERADSLVVFSLAELVSDVVNTVSRASHVKLRLQSPRVPGHVIGHRRELSDALSSFLSDVAGAKPGAQGPVLTLKERRHTVELTVIDLKLGVPEPAMQRAVLAPSVPPPGLEPLARFVRAIEESHGDVRVSGEGSWGVKLTVSLIRARPRVPGQLIHLSDAPPPREQGLLASKKPPARK